MKLHSNAPALVARAVAIGLALATSACAARFPPICIAANAVRVEQVRWTTGEDMVVTYRPPQSKFSRFVGAVVTEGEDRIEIRVMQRYGRGTPPGRQQVELRNPRRLPVVLTDDVEDVTVWSSRQG